MSIRAGFKDYYTAFGLRGVLAITFYRLVRQPKKIAAYPRSARYPIHLRIRTSDISLYRDLFLNRAYEVDLPFTPRTIVDAGANVGMATLYYANKYPDARIVSIEPEPGNFAMLELNTRNYPNIVRIQGALWNADGHVSFGPRGPEATEYDRWTYEVRSDGAVKVRSLTMQSVMAMAGISSIDLLKVDIEGGEVRAFENSEIWMKTVKGVIIELHDHHVPGCRETLNKACAGFRSWDKGEMTFYMR